MQTVKQQQRSLNQTKKISNVIHLTFRPLGSPIVTILHTTTPSYVQKYTCVVSGCRAHSLDGWRCTWHDRLFIDPDAHVPKTPPFTSAFVLCLIFASSLARLHISKAATCRHRNMRWMNWIFQTATAIASAPLISLHVCTIEAFGSLVTCFETSIRTFTRRHASCVNSHQSHQEK